MSRFKPVMRDTNFLFPPSMSDWLPERHLGRFVVEIVEQLDLKSMERAYGTSGSAPFHPALLLAILVYGYATGVFSSRKLENATYDSVAFRFVAADEHPDHDTLNTFRKRFLKEIEGLMVQVLLIARTMGELNLGNIALDGSKFKANASKHSAMSYAHIKKLEEQLKEEVKRLMELAEAKAKIEARAKERFEQEQSEYQNKLDNREAKAKESGKKPRGKPPVPPEEGARGKDQINFTDEESRIMKVSDGGYDQCYNSQIAVDMESMLIVATNTVQACNDKQQVEPILDKLDALPDDLGKPEHLVADTGYFSKSNADACGGREIIPLIAVKREGHHPDPMARFTEPPPLKEDADGVEKMRHFLLTAEGRKLYAKRKCTVEPVFGIIKAIL